MTTYIICASGASLTKKDVNYCKGKGKVIVINNTYKLAPWAYMLYACDLTWWNHYPEALKFKGRKASIQYNHPDVELWPHDNRFNGLGEEILHTGGNSGYQAINLAYIEGAERIVLLGYDMQNTDGKSHWHGDHEKGLNQQTCFHGWIGHFNILAQALDKKGVEVINATRKTALTCFKRKNLYDIDF